MKRLLLLCTLLAVLSGCGKDENERQDINEKPTELTIQNSSLTFNENSGSNIINFTSSAAWTAQIINTRADEWCTIEPTKGNAGQHSLTVTLTANNTPDDRSASIILKAGDIQKTIVVTQKQKDALIVTASSFEIGAQGGEIEIEVKANVDFTYEVSENSKDWVQHIMTKALQSSKLIFKIGENDNYKKRDASILIKSGNIQETVTIYQAGSKPSIILTKNEFIVSNAGGIIAVEVSSNVDVNVELPNAIDWIKESPSRTMSTNIYYFDIAPNENYDNRNAEIKFTNKENGLSETVKIIQAPRNALILAKQEYEFDSNGGQLDFEVQTNVDITVTISNEARSWIKQVATRGLEAKTLHFDIASCNSQEDRTGIITISGGNLTQTVTIRQSNPIEIPDAAFKQYLLDNFDLNQDGLISHSEAQKITFINVYSDNIESLKGIEHFSNLISLIACPEHNGGLAMGVGGGQDTGNWRDSGYTLNDKRVSGKLKGIDVSRNHQLEYLDCSGNIITSLDLSNNVNLNYIDASFNLDLSSIVFPSQNQIYTLQLTSTSLETIDVSNLPNLQLLSIDRGLGITSIDVSKNAKLTSLNISKHKLNSVDVSHNLMLQYLDCSVGNLQTLDVSNNPNLTTLDFAFNNIKSIDVSNNTQLEVLLFQNNNINSIDVSMLPNLRTIHFGNYQKASDGSIICNNITHIDLSNNKQLISLFASLSDIPTIDISHNTALKRVFVEYNLLNTLDVSNSPILEELYCYANPNLTTVYISPEQTFTYSKDDWTKFQFIGDANYYESTDYTTDGIVKILQTATNGDGIDIVLMGDGYSDRLIANGTYDNTMQLAMEKFFSVEPYKSFRNMFNVYSVKAVSKNEEFALGTETAFSGYFGDGTYVQGNDQRVFEYANKAISTERMDEALIVVMMNSTKYAGTCYMYYPSTGNYGNGASIAYFPIGTDETALEQILHHEAGGHGFSKLADEYAYENMYEIPSYMIEQYRQQETYGWWKNADFTNDPTIVKWAHFLSDPRYVNDDLGVFEGAFTYWTGAYRPTENSIMRYNTGGFNAPSREAIYYRMNKLAYGEAWIYDYERFVEYDAINRKTSTSAYIPYRLPENIEPLHAPVVIKNSWRNAKNNAPTQYKSNGTTNTNVAGNRLHKASSLPQTTGIPRTLIVTGNNPTEGYMESGARIK